MKIKTECCKYLALTCLIFLSNVLATEDSGEDQRVGTREVRSVTLMVFSWPRLDVPQVSALQMLKRVASTSMGGEGEPSFWAIRGKRPNPDLGLAEEPLQKRNFKPNGFNQIFSLANKKMDPEFWAVRGKRGFLWPAWWKRNPLNEETADFWATRGWAKCKDFGRFNF